MIAAIDETTRAVIKKMHEGLPPSLIDVALHLRPGEAHRLIVEHWAFDRKMATFERRK